MSATTCPPSAQIGPPRPLPVGRLAPSPTGDLHLGHARSFLVAWWHARSRGGRILLRLEDLDGERSAVRYLDGVRKDLNWLGLDWDGPDYIQSSGLERLRDRAHQLSRAGFAYACVCSRKEIQNALTAPHEGEQGPLYPGTCLGEYATLEAAEQRTGKLAGLRFRSAATVIRFTDQFAGPYAEQLAETAGDFLVLRRDKLPAYQLAVVVDDAEQGVNEVVRGDDLLSSTPRQIALARALGYPEPHYFHIPLVLGANGKRLAKRERALSLATLRDMGTDPRSIVRWALESCGVHVDGRITAAEGCGLFNMETLRRTAVVLDENSLRSLVLRQSSD